MDLYLADIDGVAISLVGIPHPGVISRLCNLAKKNWLGLVTGREAAYLAERFLPALTHEISQRLAVAERICIGVEYAGIVLSFEGKEWREEVTVSHVALPDLRKAVQEIAMRYPQLIFHERKRVVITVGIPSKALTTKAWDEAHQELEQAAREITTLVSNTSGVEIQRTTKAIDIVPSGMSKAFGAKLMLDRCGFVPEHAHLFGDARADLALAEPFIEQKLPYTFWYVGRQADLSASDFARLNLQFPSRDAMFEEGAFEILGGLV